ncbi:MAG: hypothetical protein NTV49_14090 [Kiritimatiellaeota bacterium]|nr:hypothetical protein [Kiritimatiellota bacterium]
MKKFIAGLMVAVVLGGATLPAMAINDQRGGVMGFIAGCCFGIRAGAAYNDGKDIHWREWCGLIPYVGIVFSIWNGIDGASGLQTKDYAQKYGATYY